MKIAILADPLDNQSAGVHTYTRELVAALIQSNSEHEIILIREKKDTHLKNTMQIVVPNIHLPIGFSSFRLFLWIPYILRKLNVDVVIEPAHFGPFNLPKKVLRVNVIHDLTPILMPTYHRWHSQILQRLCLKPILRKSSIIVSPSNNTSNDIRTVYPFTTDKVHTIPLGLGSSFKSSGQRYDKSAIIPKHSYFLSVGTIEPRKDLITLLKAYTIFRRKNENRIKLVIVGNRGWKATAFFQSLDRHPFKDDILLLGHTSKEDLIRLYSHSIALVYPSRYEGFGLPVIEAMGCGANVICAQNSSLTEVGGELAYYFETGDADALYRRMIKVYQNQNSSTNNSMIRIAWAHSFSWKTHASILLQIIADVQNAIK